MKLSGFVVLEAPEGYLNYSWSSGQTTRTISVSEPKNYSVTVVSATNCVATSDNVTVVPYHWTSGEVTTSHVTSGEVTTSYFNTQVATTQVWGNFNYINWQQVFVLSSETENRYQGAIIGGAIGGVILLSAVAIISILLVVKRKRKKESQTSVEMSTQVPNNEYNVLPLSGDERGKEDYVAFSTPNTSSKFKWEIKFSDLVLKEIVGQGSFGVVFIYCFSSQYLGLSWKMEERKCSRFIHVFM